MKLAELFDLSGAEKNAENLKKNAKHQMNTAKIAQARLKMLKARQQLQSVQLNTVSRDH